MALELTFELPEEETDPARLVDSRYIPPEVKFQKDNLNEWLAPSKIKVLLLYIVYPMAIGTFYKNALLRRDDVDLIVTGPYTASWIPWKGGYNVPDKYAISPTIPLPVAPNVGRVPYDAVRAKLPQGWVPDVVINIDAGITWTAKPSQGYVAGVGTDAHVLNYDFHRAHCDKFFNMHPHYSKPEDYQLHYAYDPGIHYPLDGHHFQGISTLLDGKEHPNKVEKDMDAVLIGMPYPQRDGLATALRNAGVKLLYENGPVFDEYRELNNRAKIGLNWSSLDDLVARVFELMAMGLPPVINRVPDLKLFFEEGVHYLGFNTADEAASQVRYLLNNPEYRETMAQNALRGVQPYTYDKLVDVILTEAGF